MGRLMHKNIPPNDDKADIPNNNIPKPDIMPAENNWFIIQPFGDSDMTL